MTVLTATKRLVRGVFGAPEYDRLAIGIAQAWIELDRQLHASSAAPCEGAAESQAPPVTITKPWARAACRFLLQAESCLAAWNIQEGWVALTAAQRAILANDADGEGILRAATALRQEARKLDGWRAKAIADLICGEDGELHEDLKSGALSEAQRMRVIDAIAYRDDFFHTSYFKILLRRRHLFQLFLLLWLVIAVAVLLAMLNILPDPLSDRQQLAWVFLFGILGAGVSVAQSLVAADVSARIPAQQIGAFVVWMRPAIGAAAALIAVPLLKASKLSIVGVAATDPAVVLAVAFAAGFSERFIVGAIERIADPASGGGSK